MDYEVKGRNVAERAANNRGSWAAVVVVTVVLVVALTMRNELVLMAQPVWATLSTLARVFLLLLGLLFAGGVLGGLLGLVFVGNPADNAVHEVAELADADVESMPREMQDPIWDPMWDENIGGYDSKGNPLRLQLGEIAG